MSPAIPGRASRNHGSANVIEHAGNDPQAVCRKSVASPLMRTPRVVMNSAESTTPTIAMSRSRMMGAPLMPGDPGKSG